MLLLIFTIGVTVLTVWLQRAQASPALLHFGVYALVAIGAAMLMIVVSISPQAVFEFNSASMRGTYVYVWQDPGESSFLHPSPLLFAAIPAGIWLQQRFGAMYHPRLTIWLIWPQLIATLHGHDSPDRGSANTVYCRADQPPRPVGAARPDGAANGEHRGAVGAADLVYPAALSGAAGLSPPQMPEACQPLNMLATVSWTSEAWSVPQKA